MASVYGTVPSHSVGLRATGSTHIPQNSGSTPYPLESTPTSVSCRNGGLFYQRFHGQCPPKLVIGLPGDIYLDTSPSSPALYLRRTDRWELIQSTTPLGNSSIRHPTCNDFILTFRASQWPFWIRDAESKSPVSESTSSTLSPDATTHSSSSAKVASEKNMSATPPITKKRKHAGDDSQPRKVSKAHHTASKQPTPDPHTKPKPKKSKTPKSKVAPYPLPVVKNRAKTHKYYWDIVPPADDCGTPGDFFFLMSPDGRPPRAYVRNTHWDEIPDNLGELRTKPIWNSEKSELALSITPGGVAWLSPSTCTPLKASAYTISDWLMQLLGKTPVQLKGGILKPSHPEPIKQSTGSASTGAKVNNATTMASAESLEKYRRLEAEVAKLSRELQQLRACRNPVKRSVSVGTEADSPKSALKWERGVQTASVKDAPPKVSTGVGRDTEYSGQATQTFIPSTISTGMGPVVEYSSQTTQTLSVLTSSKGVGTEVTCEEGRKRTQATQTETPYPVRGIESDGVSCKTCRSRANKRSEHVPSSNPNLLHSISYRKSRLRNEITEPPGPSNKQRGIEGCFSESSNLPRPVDDTSPHGHEDKTNELQDVQVHDSNLRMSDVHDGLAERDLNIFFRQFKETGTRRCRFCMHVVTPPRVTEFPPTITAEQLRTHCEEAHKEFWIALGKMSERKVQEMHEKFEKLDSRQ